MPLSQERKAEYFERMKDLLSSYKKCFIVNVDNVGSQQLQETRKALRGQAEILMGKNTMMRKVIADFLLENEDHPIGILSTICRGNVGFVFTNGDLGDVRTVLESNVRPAPARVGSLAPVDVIVPKGPTGCDPGQPAFFQTLQISTKIAKGQIEIVNDVQLVKAGEKVNASQAALLKKLEIQPFFYGLVLKSVYDNGSLFDAKVLDITDDVLSFKFGEALSLVASLSLVLGYPTAASVPHSIANAFRAIVAITMGLEKYTFPEAEAFLTAAPSGGGGGGGAAGGEAAAAAEPEPEEEEEIDMGGGMDMFGGEEAGGGDY